MIAQIDWETVLTGKDFDEDESNYTLFHVKGHRDTESNLRPMAVDTVATFAEVNVTEGSKAKRSRQDTGWWPPSSPPLWLLTFDERDSSTNDGSRDD